MTRHRNETYRKNKKYECCIREANKNQLYNKNQSLKPVLKEHTNHTQNNRKYFSDQRKNPIRNTKQIQASR
jgi:hypothetical protein